jgi:hypothetical protein
MTIIATIEAGSQKVMGSNPVNYGSNYFSRNTARSYIRARKPTGHPVIGSFAMNTKLLFYELSHFLL